MKIFIFEYLLFIHICNIHSPKNINKAKRYRHHPYQRTSTPNDIEDQSLPVIGTVYKNTPLERTQNQENNIFPFEDTSMTIKTENTDDDMEYGYQTEPFSSDSQDEYDPETDQSSNSQDEIPLMIPKSEVMVPELESILPDEPRDVIEDYLNNELQRVKSEFPLHEIIASTSTVEEPVEEQYPYTKAEKKCDEEEMLDQIGYEIHMIYLFRKQAFWETHQQYHSKLHNKTYDNHDNIKKLQNRINFKNHIERRQYRREYNDIMDEFESEEKDLLRTQRKREEEIQEEYKYMIQMLTFKFMEMAEKIDEKSKQIGFLPNKKNYEFYENDITNELSSKEETIPSRKEVDLLVFALKKYAKIYTPFNPNMNFQDIHQLYHLAIEKAQTCVKNNNLYCNDLLHFYCGRMRYRVNTMKKCRVARQMFSYITLEDMKSIVSEIKVAKEISNIK